jgi:hypothetical protein
MLARASARWPKALCFAPSPLRRVPSQADDFHRDILELQALLAPLKPGQVGRAVPASLQTSTLENERVGRGEGWNQNGASRISS